MNPITAEMTVMRTNLWPGLINTLLYNQESSATRVRLFEIGTCFITARKKIIAATRLAGLITGLLILSNGVYLLVKLIFMI